LGLRTRPPGESTGAVAALGGVYSDGGLV